MVGLYGATRAANDVVALTDRMTRVATMKSPTGQALRNMAVAFVSDICRGCARQ